MEFSLDTRLLDKFEQFSHWTQRTFGLDCFSLAKLSALLFLILFYLNRPFRIFFFWCLIIISWLTLIEKIERTAKTSCIKGFENPFKETGIVT